MIFALTAVPGKKLRALSRYVFGIGTPVYNPSMLAPSLIDPTNKTASVYENAMGVVFDKDPAVDLRFAVNVPDPSRPSAPLVVPIHESPIEQFESSGENGVPVGRSIGGSVVGLKKLHPSGSLGRLTY